jgi:hypothetical protein
MNNSDKREIIPVLNCGEGFFGYAVGIREILKATVYSLQFPTLFLAIVSQSQHFQKKKKT